MKCPRCQSDDVTRSRRRLVDRLVQPIVRGRILRCRDCHKRFWVGVEWGAVILGALTAAVTVVVITAMVIVAARQSHRETPAPVPVQARRYRIPRPIRPANLPPLSSVPTPNAQGTESTPAGDR